VSVNEEVDPSAIIRRLRQEVRNLKEELKLIKGVLDFAHPASRASGVDSAAAVEAGYCGRLTGGCLAVSNQGCC
jgi:hypothetical protein